MNNKFTKSFFDDNQPSESFWLKQPIKIVDTKIEYQCMLFKKSKKTGFWISRNYLLYEGQLIKPTCKYQHIVNLNLSRIQLISYENNAEKDHQDKQKFGFRIIRNQKSKELFSRSKELNQHLWDLLKQHCLLVNFKEDYSMEKVVGKGNFAKVYQSVNKISKKLYAVKVFEKSQLLNSETDKLALLKEMTIMRKINHKGLIKMQQVYEDEKNIYFVLDYLAGGELQNHIKPNQKLPEKLVAKIIATLLDSLDYLHKQNILHRDLKPENMILRNKGILEDVVITDFGLADFYLPSGNYMFSRCGTPGFVAPEVLQDKTYDFKVDIFSVGCLMFNLLTGKSPFRGTAYDEVVMRNYHCKIDYESIEGDVSSECLQLIKQLLHPKPQYRPAARVILKHHWFLKNLDKSRYLELTSDSSDTKESTNKSSLTDLSMQKNNKSSTVQEFSTPQINSLGNEKKDVRLFTPQATAMQVIQETEKNEDIKQFQGLDDDITDLIGEDESPQSHRLPQYQLTSKLKTLVDSNNCSRYSSSIAQLQQNSQPEFQETQSVKIVNKVMNNLKSLQY